MTRERWALIMIGATVAAMLSVAIVGATHTGTQRPALCTTTTKEIV